MVSILNSSSKTLVIESHRVLNHIIILDSEFIAAIFKHAVVILAHNRSHLTVRIIIISVAGHGFYPPLTLDFHRTVAITITFLVVLLTRNEGHWHNYTDK